MYIMHCFRRTVYIYLVTFYFTSFYISFFTFGLGSALAKETSTQKTISFPGTDEEELAKKSELKEKHFHFIPNVFVDKPSEFSDGIKVNLKGSVYEERKKTIKNTDTEGKNDKRQSQEEPEPRISNFKTRIPLELQTKLKYQRDKFIRIVTSPYVMIQMVYNFFYSCIHSVFSFIVHSIHRVVSYFYLLTKRINLFFYNLVVQLPCQFLQYIYYQCGSLIFFFSLPLLFGLLGGILLAAVSEGLIQFLSTYIFSPQLNEAD